MAKLPVFPFKVGKPTILIILQTGCYKDSRRILPWQEVRHAYPALLYPLRPSQGLNQRRGLWTGGALL